MNAKKILFVIGMFVLTIFNLLFLLFGLSVLGKRESVITQIGTIFFPMLIAYVIVGSTVLLLVESFLLWKKCGHKYLISLVAVSAVVLILTSVEGGQYRAVVKSNGGSVSFFRALTVSNSVTNDEQVVYATKDSEDLTISVYNAAGRMKGELRPVYVYIHGKKDSLVPIEGSERYVEMLNEAGGDAVLVPLPYCNHGLGNQANSTIIWNFVKKIDGMFVK